MKSQLLLSLLVAATVAAGVSLLLDQNRDPAAVTSEGGSDLTALREEIAELRDLVNRNSELNEARLLSGESSGRSAELESRLERLETAAREAPPSEAVPDGEKPATPADATPEGARLRAMRAAKEKKFEAARDQLKELLDQELEQLTRLRVLRDLGLVYRGLGEHNESEAMLLELLRIAEPDSIANLEASYHLAVTKNLQGEHGAAIAYMEDVARSAQAEEVQVGLAHVRIAEYSLAQEDPTRARAELQFVWERHKDSADPKSKWLIGEARKIARGLPKQPRDQR